MSDPSRAPSRAESRSPSSSSRKRRTPRAWSSVRLWLLVGVSLALLLPMLLWWRSGVSARPSPAMMLSVWLAQWMAVMGVLGLIWQHRVRSMFNRLLARVQWLVSESGSMSGAPRAKWRWRYSTLDLLEHRLRQAQARAIKLGRELDARHVDLHRMAMYDGLTGLPNRRLFRDLMHRALSQARRDGRSMALMFIDLDFFKEVNDRFGHAAGDELLRCMAQRLSQTVRGADLVGRVGGDEFLALLPDTADAEAIAQTALRMIRSIELPVPLSEGTCQAQVSASIGVARYPADGTDFELLLKHADHAMYRAKALGRGRFVLFHSDEATLPPGELMTPPQAAFELAQALERDELQLCYQPVIDTASGYAAGAEALVRWHHPELGVMTPARFIRRAEESGQLHALEQRTLELACAQLAQWKQMSQRPGRLSINVAVAEFRHPTWAQNLARAMQRHGIDAGELAIELTESALLHDSDELQERLQALQRMGVALIIDDFGSGAMPVRRLAELRPTLVKLDAGIVQRLPQDGAARSVVQAVVGMTRALGVVLVAEGVETAAQRDLLIELGCALQQGYLFGWPQPALPEPAWALPRADVLALPQRGANDSRLGELPASDIDRLPDGMQPPRRA